MSFVIYAFVQYAEATGKTEPLDAAMELFRTLDQHCYDHENGGYQEFFYEDFRVIADPNESGYIGAIGTKTYNSHLHLMEAFTALFETRPDAIVRQRLSELLQINTVSVKHPSLACNLDGWNLDWSMIRTPKNLRTSYGHDVECVWLALDAARALNRPSRSLAGWAQAICDQSIKHGYDQEHGGFFYTGPLDRSSDDRKKEWWTQSEALVAMLTMQRLFKDDPETKARYRKIFDRTLSFVRTHHLVGSEDRPGGGWWATVHENGDPIDSPSRTSMWQGAYHNGRALLECESLLLDGGKKADR